jgi:hypothetical protein
MKKLYIFILLLGVFGIHNLSFAKVVARDLGSSLAVSNIIINESKIVLPH